MLAERRARIGDLAVHRQLEQIVKLLMGQAMIDEVKLDGRLLHPLREVLFVEREAKLAVLEYVVRSGLVVPPSGCLFH